MAVKVKIAPMKVGFGETKKEAYVGRVQLGETVDTEMLVEQIHLRTGMAEAQIKMALENMTESIAHFFKMGNGVRLGELGIIKPTIKTRSAETEDEVQIVKLKYLYTPSVKMKKALEELELRKLDEYEEDAEDDDDEPENGSDDGGGQDFS